MAMLITPVSVFADEETSVTAYVTVSQYGEFVNCADGSSAVLLPVELSGSSSYTLDDLFAKVHNLYSNSEYYGSATSDYGAYITKFWGDESGNFGYQINGGSEAVMGLSHQVEDGDYVDVAIYKSLYPDTEAYTKFDIVETKIQSGDTLELTLSQAGYDENWNTVFSPCEEAVITIDGTDTDYMTDFDGKVSLNFDTCGTYTISAHKTKTVKETVVPAITAPICKVTVSEPEYMTLIRNIAEKYSGTTLKSDINMVWFLADIAVYNELYPENEVVLSDSIKQACLDKIIADANGNATPGALSKDIIALRAMGYDPRNVYNSKSVNLDIVEKLTALVDAQDDAVTNVYTLPYVIIALRQGEGYATEEQMNFLINSAISSKDTWLNDQWGTDAISAMLLALAPYYNTYEEVKALSDQALEILISSIDENGLTGNAASTGLAITALSAFGIDCDEMGITEGLLTQKSEDMKGFEPMENSFSTEQGFRGLLAWQLFENDTNRIMYDFSSYPENEARSTKKSSSGGGGGGGSYTPPKKDDVITEEEKTEEVTEEKVEDVPKPDTKNPDVKIMPISAKGKTFNDIAESKNKVQIEALAERGIINGKTENNFDPYATMTRAEFATIIARGLGLPEKESANFKDVKPEDWFFKHINTAYHYGIIKGVSDTEFNPNGVISRQEAAVMIARASKLCGADTVISENDTRDILAAFTDYTKLESWAKESMAYCFNSGILSDENIEINPAYKVSREDVASMLYNMLEKTDMLREETK